MQDYLLWTLQGSWSNSFQFKLLSSNPSTVISILNMFPVIDAIRLERTEGVLHSDIPAFTQEIDLHYFYSHCSADLRNYFDIADRGSSNNIMSTLGFGIAIRDVLRLVVHGLMFAGVPCFSFVWVSRSNTGRSASCPLACCCRLSGSAMLPHAQGQQAIFQVFQRRSENTQAEPTVAVATS